MDSQMPLSPLEVEEKPPEPDGSTRPSVSLFSVQPHSSGNVFRFKSTYLKWNDANTIPLEATETEDVGSVSESEASEKISPLQLLEEKLEHHMATVYTRLDTMEAIMHENSADEKRKHEKLLEIIDDRLTEMMERLETKIDKLFLKIEELDRKSDEISIKDISSIVIPKSPMSVASLDNDGVNLSSTNSNEMEKQINRNILLKLYRTVRSELPEQYEFHCKNYRRGQLDAAEQILAHFYSLRETLEADWSNHLEHQEMKACMEGIKELEPKAIALKEFLGHKPHRFLGTWKKISSRNDNQETKYLVPGVYTIESIETDWTLKFLTWASITLDGFEWDHRKCCLISNDTIEIRFDNGEWRSYVLEGDFIKESKFDATGKMFIEIVYERSA